MELARDRVKAAEAAGRSSNRFHLAMNPPRSPIAGAPPPRQRRRRESPPKKA